MRYLAEKLIQDLELHMVLLSGPRQCGKTTLSKGLLKERYEGVYLNWDQIKDRRKIQNQTWSDAAELVILDEVHKKKAWKNFVKGIYDTKPDKLKLLVTGSARLELYRKSGDSMFGRFRSLRLHPFCMAEDPLNLSPERRFERLLERGGFPAPYLQGDSDEVQRWRNQRWSLLLREDLRDLESIKDIQSLELLAELLKSRAAGMLSYANLAEDVEIAPKTVKAWVQALERLYLIFLVTPWSGSIKRALSKTPKVYFMDPGDLLEQDTGPRIENLVAVNLLKRIHYIEDAYGDRVSLHYIRDKEGRETDFVITLNKKPVALIEVKKSFQDPDPSLIYFGERLRITARIQLHAEAGRKPYVKSGVRVISLQSFLSQPVTARKFWEGDFTR